MTARLVRQLTNRTALVMVVEDDPRLAKLIVRFLEYAGYETAEASDGIEAVERAGSFQPDLIIMDLMLPHLTGGEAAQRIKGDPFTEHIPIIAITGVEDAEGLVEVLPIDGVLVKPFDLEDLRSLTAELLDNAPASSFLSQAG
jgi:CheY-like chemotaxis protein